MDDREIDRLIAEKIMEFQPFYRNGYLVSFETEFGSLFFPDDEERDWKPSIDIGDAWLVVDKWVEEGRYFSIHKHIDGGFVIKLEIDSEPYEKVFGESYSAPMAICLAALKTVGVEVN